MGQGVRQCVVVVEHGAAVVSILGRLHVGGGASRDLESLWGFYRVYISGTVASCKSSVKT